jgi:hypothetical protein
MCPTVPQDELGAGGVTPIWWIVWRASLPRLDAAYAWAEKE